MRAYVFKTKTNVLYKLQCNSNGSHPLSDGSLQTVSVEKGFMRIPT